MRADMFLRCKRKKRSTPVQSNHIHVLYRRQFCFYHQREIKMYDTVIKSVRILDGSGAPWYRGDIGIQDGKIQTKGHDEKNHYFISEKEETGKVTQKKILLKSMRALEFQCPLKFRCQTRVPVSASPTPVFCASASPVQYGMPSFICRAAALLFAAVTPSLCKYAAVLPTV